MAQAYKKTEIELAAKEIKSDLVRLGLNRVSDHVDLVMRDAIKRSESLEQFRQKVFDLIAKKDPKAAINLYQQAEGRRYWEYLKTDDLKIELSGKQVAVKDALVACAAIKDENVRLERFKEIIGQIAEKFRLREKDGQQRNGFGISYDLQSSDPSELMDPAKRSFNCISGSIILGQMIMYAAAQVDVQEHVSVKAQLVASYSLGGRWDDGGHVMLRVDIKDKAFFFDSSNMFIANHGSNLILNPEKPTQVTMKTFRTVTYNLGEAADLTPKFMEVVRFQDRLFDMHGAIDPKTADQILKMPPIFIAYFVGHLTENQQRAFFKSFDTEDIRRIKSPALRFKLSVLAASVYAESNPARARAFGALALTSLSATITDRAERDRMPLGNLLDSSIQLVKIMKRDNDLLVRSGIWAYLPYVIANSTGELSKLQAAEVRSFLTAFYEKNDKIFDKLEAGPVINCVRGLLTLDNIVGAESSQTEVVLNVLCAKMGINRSRLIASLRSKAKESYDPHRESVLARTDANYILEISFLNITNEIFSETMFSLENLRYRVANSPIVGHAVYAILKEKESLHSIFFATNVQPLGRPNKDLRVKAKELGLV